MRTYRFLVLFAFAALLTGCAAAPVVQVVGMGLTGYDIASRTDMLDRDKIDHHARYAQHDKVIERRMRERLILKGIPSATAFSFNAHVYLVGEFPDKQKAAEAIRVAKSVQGVRVLTCRFFQYNTPPNPCNEDLTKTVRNKFLSHSTLDSERIRVSVFSGNAVVMGIAPDDATKQAALTIAKNTDGVTEVVDYVEVIPPKPATTTETAKSKKKKSDG